MTKKFKIIETLYSGLEEEKISFIRNYNDLNVYKIAYKLALELHKITADFPLEEKYGVTAQIRRASKSICANIAEGFAKQKKSSSEFSRFL